MTKKLEVPTTVYTEYEVSDDGKYVKMRGLVDPTRLDYYDVWIRVDQLQDIIDAYEEMDFDFAEEEDEEEEDDCECA